MRSDFTNLEGSKFEAKTFLFKIENDLYYIRGVIFNPDGDRLDITKQSMKSIEFKDNIYDTFITGSLTLINVEDSLERTPIPGKKNSYRFRGDGRDVLFIEIIPVKNNKHQENINGSQNLKYNLNFGFQNLFSIVDDQKFEINGIPHKKLKLMDFDKKKRKESKINYIEAKTLEDAANKAVKALGN